MAVGAAILVFPEGNPVAAGGNCSSAAIPDPNDPGWIDWQRVESWDFSRKDAKYEPVKDGSTGKLRLVDEEETDGHNEYKFTCNVLKALFWRVFFRGAATNAAGQFDQNKASSPRCWIILVQKDAQGNIVFAANIWGRIKLDALKGGGGALVKPDITITEYDLALQTAQVGSN